MKYFYSDKDNNPVGPLPREALESLKAAGIISETTMVAEEGASGSKPFHEVFAPQSTAPPPLTPAHEESTSGTIAARKDTYKELGNIAQAATTKLLHPFLHPSDDDRNAPIEEVPLSFLLYADDFTENCCQRFANTLRGTSVLHDVRGTPTSALARQIREDCFSNSAPFSLALLKATGRPACCGSSGRPKQMRSALQRERWRNTCRA